MTRKEIETLIDCSDLTYEALAQLLIDALMALQEQEKAFDKIIGEHYDPEWCQEYLT